MAVVLPFAGFLAALWLLWGSALTARDLLILAVTYVLVGLGVTVGFHRMLTPFEAKPWLRATLAILGSMSVQGAVIHWVADHRRHHAFTDEEDDPHSPHTHSGEGWRGVLTGLWHSHMGWLFEDQPPARPAIDAPLAPASAESSSQAITTRIHGGCCAKAGSRAFPRERRCCR